MGLMLFKVLFGHCITIAYSCIVSTKMLMCLILGMPPMMPPGSM